MPWPESPVQLHRFSCSCCFGRLDTSWGSPMLWAPCRQREPALGGWLSATCPTQGWPGMGTECGTKPQCEVGVGQQAGPIDKEGGAGTPCSSSPPACGLVHCVPHHQCAGGCHLWSSWDAARGRPCHRACHPASLTGSGCRLRE